MKTTLLKPSLTSIACALLLAGGVSVHAQSYSNAVIALHPVAYWPLQEATAPPASASTALTNYGTLGSAGDGVLNGNVVAGTVGSPVAGAAVNAFDGIITTSGSFSRAPYSAAGSPPLPFTIEAWINTAYPVNTGPGGANQNVILSDYSASPDANHRTGWVLFNDYWKDEQSGYVQGDFALKSYANGTSTANPHFFNIMNPNTVQAGVWYHVVIVLTSSNAVSYVNGVLTSNAPINNAYTYVPNNNNGGASTGLTIATRGANSTDNTLNWGGAVAEVAYYSNVMAATDALADYNARTNKTTYEALIAARHPIFWYKMDELTNQPVAKNYGTLGTAGDGYYPSVAGVNPGVAGPTNSGFGPLTNAFQSASTYGILTSGPGVPCGIANPAIWNLSGSITLSAWAAASPSFMVNQQLLSKGSDSYRLVYDSGDYPDFDYAGNVLIGANKIQDTAWHFWVATYNSTNQVATLYIDGVQSASATWATAPAVGGTASELLIGGTPFYADEAFIGSLAHVAINNSALSSATVSNLYAIAVGHQPPAVATPVFPNATAECWSSSTYVFQPVFNGYGAALTYAWTLDSGSGPVTINGATGPSLAFQSIPGMTAGGSPYTLAVTATSLYGSTNSSVTLTVDAPPTVAQTIYSDSFARSGQLTGSEPDTADLYSAVWSVDGSFSCIGSQALASSAYQFDAWLPFVPQVGHVYILSCDLNPLNSDANWLGLGFSTAQDSGLDTNVIATTVEARGNRAYVSGGAVLIPDVASNPSGTGVTPYDAAGVSTYQVQLDTTTEPWTVTTWEDGIMQGSLTQYGSDPSIASVVMENYQTGGGTFDNLKLTDSAVRAPGAPVIIANPPAQLYAVQAFQAEVPAAAAGATSYQWQFNGNNLADNGRIVGSHTNRLTILAALPGDAGSYQLIAWNGSGSVTSSPCALTVGTAPVSFVSANDPGAWTVNTAVGSQSYGSPILTSNVLTLTDGSLGEGCTAFFNVPQYIGGFYAQFTYQVVNPSAPLGDGATFCLQDDPRGPTACGGVTYNFGLRGGAYSTSVAPSAELVLNLYTTMAAVGYSWNTHGHVTVPTQQTPGHVNIINGDPITMSLYYNGGTLALTMTDSGPVATNSFSTNLAVGDITAVVGSKTAYVGFSGSDGDAASTQIITNFSFVSLPTLPGLAISENTSGAAVITWPGTFAGFSLQQKADVTSTNWVNVTNPVTINTSGNCQVTVPSAGAPRFYRLAAGLQ